MRLGLGILGLRQTRVRARARLRVLTWMCMQLWWLTCVISTVFVSRFTVKYSLD